MRMASRVLLTLGISLVIASCSDVTVPIAPEMPQSEAHIVSMMESRVRGLESSGTQELNTLEARLRHAILNAHESSEARAQIREVIAPGSGTVVIGHPDSEIAALISDFYAVRAIRWKASPEEFTSDVEQYTGTKNRY